MAKTMTVMESGEVFATPSEGGEVALWKVGTDGWVRAERVKQ